MVAPELIYRNSHFFENLLEHRFLYDLCRTLVLRTPAELANIMRSEVDAFGFDLVVAVGQRTVHIQMKTRSGSPEPTPYKISEALWRLPNAVAIWMLYDPSTLEPISYYVLGAPLPPMEDFSSAGPNRCLSLLGSRLH
jgi:hypothetical protein